MKRSEKHQLPPVLPLWKFIYRFRQITKDPLSFLTRLFAEHGPIYIGQLGFNRVYVTQNPDHIQHILQKNNRNYSKSPALKKIARYAGWGLLTSDGDYWLQQRRLIQPGFHRQKLEGLSAIMVREIDDFIIDFNKHIAENNEIDISKEMMRLTFKVVSKSLFHTGLSENELDRVDYVITTLQHEIIQQIRKPFLKPWFYFSGSIARCNRLKDEVDSIIFRVIRERQESGESHDDMLDMLINTRYEDTGKGMTLQQLRDESLILFLAGHETSANALTWTWYLLSQHPEVKKKVVDEVERVVGDGQPGFQHVPKLIYTKQVIDESMRLFPPAWIIDRLSIEEDQLNEYYVPPNTMVNIFVWGVHRDPDLWPDPEKFDPERFHPDHPQIKHPFAYFPFGGGPRMCIGKSFAFMEMQLILAKMIREYDFQLVPGQEIKTDPLVTLRPLGEIRMRVEKK